MKKTRWLSVVLALVLVFSLGTSAFAADSANRQFSKLPVAKLAPSSSLYQAGDQVRVVVLTESRPLAENHGVL